MSLPLRDGSRSLVATESQAPASETLSAAQLALPAVPGVALNLTLKLLISGYRRALARPGERPGNFHDDYL